MQKRFMFLTVLLLCSFVSVAYATESTIWDDDAAFWSAGPNTVLTGEYTIIASGEYSVNITTTGTGSMAHTYGVNQDLTPYLNYTWYFWWYGNATGASLYFNLYNTSYAGGSYPFYDNYRGWHLYSFQPNEEMAIAAGFDWATVKIIQISSLDTTNKWFMDRIYFDNEGIAEEVTNQMISTDWLTFGGLVFLCILGAVFILKSRNYLLNFIFGTLVFGAGVALLGTNTVLSGWINLIAVIMGVVCMLDAFMLWRNG